MKTVNLSQALKHKNRLAGEVARLREIVQRENSRKESQPARAEHATRIKAQIARFGLATLVGEIQPQGCIMAGEAPEPPWIRGRREKKARHKSERREGQAESLVEGV